MLTLDTKIATNRQLWDQAAETYTQKHRISLPFQELLWPALRKTIDDMQIKTALDVGCGPGDLCGHLRQKGIQATGTDISAGMITIARQSHPDIAFQKQSVEKLGRGHLKNQFFDAIFCINVLNNIEKYQKALRLMFNRLNSGGHLIVTVLHPYRTSLEAPEGYFEEQSYPSNFVATKSPVMRWHRSYEEYFHAFRQISPHFRLNEIGWLKEDQQESPELSTWRQKQSEPHFPIFLMLDLEKK